MIGRKTARVLLTLIMLSAYVGVLWVLPAVLGLPNYLFEVLKIHLITIGIGSLYAFVMYLAKRAQ